MSEEIISWLSYFRANEIISIDIIYRQTGNWFQAPTKLPWAMVFNSVSIKSQLI